MKTLCLTEASAKVKAEAWQVGLTDGREGRSNGNPYERAVGGLSEGVRLLLKGIYDQAYEQGRRQRGQADSR